MADPRPIAIVTGGARGIGLGISRALAAAGWDLAVVGVRPRRMCPARWTSSRPEADGCTTCRRTSPTRANAAASSPRSSARSARRRRWSTTRAAAPRVRADLLDATEESFEELRPDQPAGPVLPDAGRGQRDARRPLRRAPRHRLHHLGVRGDGVRAIAATTA